MRSAGQFALQIIPGRFDFFRLDTCELVRPDSSFQISHCTFCATNCCQPKEQDMEQEGHMQEFLVQCRWPDGSMEYFLSDSETEARSWAADARRDADCAAGVYGLLVLETPDIAASAGTQPVTRYAGYVPGRSRFQADAVKQHQADAETECPAEHAGNPQAELYPPRTADAVFRRLQ
jgi:hypothetical protein